MFRRARSWRLAINGNAGERKFTVMVGHSIGGGEHSIVPTSHPFRYIPQGCWGGSALIHPPMIGLFSSVVCACSKGRYDIRKEDTANTTMSPRCTVVVKECPYWSDPPSGLDQTAGRRPSVAGIARQQGGEGARWSDECLPDAGC